MVAPAEDQQEKAHNAARDARRCVLGEAFFARSTLEVARELLGCHLMSEVGGVLSSGIIVETEAYLGPDDLASHSRFGPTPRNRPMFGPPGRHYIYRSHGLHWCYNVVTQAVGVAEAVLVRALRPEQGIAIMRERRGSGVAIHALCRGPGNLSRALGIDGSLNGLAAFEPPVWMEMGEGATSPILSGPRIGVSGHRDAPWRFWFADEPSVSARRTQVTVTEKQ